MDCQRSAELMPWYLNGTLDAAERRQVEEHLEGCEACRGERSEAAAAELLFGGHPSAKMLIDFARERPEVPRELVEAHLADCKACADELAMVLESRAEMGRGRQTGGRKLLLPLPSPRQTPPRWRAAALAAALLGLIGIASGVWSWRMLEHRGAEFAERQQASESRIAELEAEIRGLPAPRVNVPIHDLWPDGSVLRSEAAGPATLPAGDGPAATLILNTRLEPGQEAARLEIRDSEGQVLHSLTGLQPTPGRSFTISLALDRLPRGELRIHLFSATGREPLESYTFELE